MTDNRILTRSDLLVKEPTPLEDFARATAYSALQQPVSGVAQLIDKTTNKTEHLKNVQFLEQCQEVKFGTARWHAQTAGSAAGTLLPFLVSLRMSKGILGRTAAQSHLAAETGLGITLTEAACAGFINDSLFRPVDPNKNFVQERLLNGSIGALNFTVLTATGLGLNKLGDYRTLGLLKNPIAIGVLSGVPAGALGANLESIKEHGRIASGEETSKSIYQMSFAGGALGIKQKLLGLHDGTAKTDTQPPQAKPDEQSIQIVLRTPADAVPPEPIVPGRLRVATSGRGDTTPPAQTGSDATNSSVLPRTGDTAIIPLDAIQAQVRVASPEKAGTAPSLSEPDIPRVPPAALGKGSVVVRPTDLRPPDSVATEQASQAKPRDTTEVPPERREPPPITKETELPIAEDIVELKVARGSRPKRTVPPERTDPIVEKTEPVQDFYTKQTNYKGIPIRAAECVPDQALLEAHRRIEMMLENAPEVVERLYEKGSEFYVIGKDQAVSDLPDLRHYKGVPFDGDQTIDQRTRGVGGPQFACAGEENLLKLPGDRYAGRDITVHEFAHTIHMAGLPRETVARIRARYEEAKAEGRWTGAYAIKNDLEYFAELTMWYFGGRGDHGKISPAPLPGREWLRSYDPKGFELLESIYRSTRTQPVETSIVLKPLSIQITGLKSVGGLAPIKLEIKNDGNKPASVHWVTPEGTLRPYATVQPKGTFTQPTFAGHYWKIGDHYYYTPPTTAPTAQVFVNN